MAVGNESVHDTFIFFMALPVLVYKPSVYLKMKMDGMNPVPSATVYRIFSSIFVFCGINENGTKTGRDTPGSEPKMFEHFFVHIVGIPFLTKIFPFSSGLYVPRDKHRWR